MVGLEQQLNSVQIVANHWIGATMNPQNDNGLRTCNGCGKQFPESHLEFVESHSDVSMCQECRENYIKCWDCMEWKDRREVTFHLHAEDFICEACICEFLRVNEENEDD